MCSSAAAGAGRCLRTAAAAPSSCIRAARYPLRRCRVPAGISLLPLHRVGRAMVPPQDAFRIAPMHRIGRSDGRMAAGGCQPGASGCGSNADFFVSTIWSYRLEPLNRSAGVHAMDLPGGPDTEPIRRLPIPSGIAFGRRQPFRCWLVRTHPMQVLADKADCTLTGGRLDDDHASGPAEDSEPFDRCRPAGFALPPRLRGIHS